MSDLVVPGFKSSEIIDELSTAIGALPVEEKEKLLKQIGGVFQFDVKNEEGKTEMFTVDCKKDGTVVRGKGTHKPDAILSLKDEDFVSLATGKLNGQKAYMSGKLKIKGQVMLTMKIDKIFNIAKPKANL